MPQNKRQDKSLKKIGNLYKRIAKELLVISRQSSITFMLFFRSKVDYLKMILVREQLIPGISRWTLNDNFYEFKNDNTTISPIEKCLPSPVKNALVSENNVIETTKSNAR